MVLTEYYARDESLTYTGFFFGFDYLSSTAFLGLGLQAAFELEKKKKGKEQNYILQNKLLVKCLKCVLFLFPI